MQKFLGFLMMLLASLILMAIWAPLGIAVLFIAILALLFAPTAVKSDKADKL